MDSVKFSCGISMVVLRLLLLTSGVTGGHLSGANGHVKKTVRILLCLTGKYLCWLNIGFPYHRGTI